MKYFFFSLASLVMLLPSASLASEVEGEFGLGSGYRLDALDWNISGHVSGCCPNVLSELKWSDIAIYEIKGSARAIIEEALYFRGFIGYGFIHNGDNRDSDYLGDNRTYEFSRSINDSGDGGTFDASFGAGYRLGERGFWAAPMLGYSYHEQNLTVSKGYQELDPYGLVGFTGPFDGLNSTYDARWKGPWAGIDLHIDPEGPFSLLLSAEYHWADFKASADWNLRGDLRHPVSFIHEADATGGVFAIGGSYAVTEMWLIDLSLGYQKWAAGPGLDWTYLADGTAGVTRLNDVNWESASAMLALKRRL